MATLTLRIPKGSALTYQEMDDNLTALNTEVEAATAAIDGLYGTVRRAWWEAAGNSGTITTNNNALTITGTATTAVVATTNAHTLTRRVESLVTVAATNAVAGWRVGAAMWLAGGPAAGRGGFEFVGKAGPATGVATATTRYFFGMTNVVSAPTDVEPSSLVNMIGMGWDAADTNIQMMHNDGSGTATKIDLGASFPVPTVDRTSMYLLELTAAPGTTQRVVYHVMDIGTGDSARGTITTDLPSTSTFIGPRVWMSVGGTSSVIGVALANMQIGGGL